MTEPSVLRGWRENWKRKFFEIPSFLAKAERYPGRSHDEFVVVVGTTGYTTTGAIEHDAKEADGEFYENGGDDDTRVFSARLTPAVGDPYTWTLQYDLVPDNRNLMRGLALYWTAIVIVGAISAVAATVGPAEWTSMVGRSLSGAIGTGTLGIVFALDADWADRYRLLCVVPLLLHGSAWFLWTVAISGGS